MNIAAIEKAVRDWLVADATLTAAVSGVYLLRAAPGVAMPYVVISLVDAAADLDSFESNTSLVTIDVRVLVDVDATAADPSSTISTIIDRIYGGSEATPTYGLHRHVLTISGGWTGSPIRFVGASTEHAENVLQYVLRFETHATKGLT